MIFEIPGVEVGTKNLRKIDPKPHPFFNHFWDRFLQRFVANLAPQTDHFGAHFGNPGGPQIDQKSQLALKILIWKLVFFCVPYPFCFEQLFASFMCRLWLKFAQNFNEKRACVIQSFALFAQPGTPSKPSFLLGKTMVFEEFVFLH